MSVAVAIVTGPLSPVSACLACAGAGAVLCFEGVVRPTEDGRALTALDYTVYEPMAGRVLHALGQDVVERFGLCGLTAEHSRGRIAVGACSFRLRVASAHRREGLLALGEFVERLKRDVPIWKAPVFAADSDEPAGARSRAEENA